ncbi:MAG: hypothetical protein ACFBSE_02075 [Prochloraceae cyanobacterium]
MNKKQFNDKLGTIIYWLKELKAFRLEEDTFSLRENKMRGIMNEIMEVYLAIQADSSLKSDPDFQRFLNDSSILLCRTMISDMPRYISSVERILTFTLEPGEWVKVCWRRSAIEAIKELYPNTVFEQYFSEIDTEDDLDLILESRGKKEGPVSEEEIPNGIPSSHWWWWGEEPEESDYEIAG